MKKKTASIIGIVVGIVIIIVGFCVQGMDLHESYSTPTIGRYIEFGADFYTEMYAVTQDVGVAVNSANKNIHGAVNVAQRNICDAIGWLIVIIGLVDVAYFIYKNADCEEDSSGNIYRAATPATVSTHTTQRQATPTPRPIATHSWRCDNCGNMRSQTPCEHCGYKENAPQVAVAPPVTTDPNKANAPVSAEIKDGEKVCPKCGTVQRADRKVCWSCGQHFAN